MYVPNPIRCRKCLRLGHFADNCAKEPICGFCSKPEHQGSPCQTIVPICVNCNEKHHSLDLKCPRLIEEKEIKTIQFREKITYGAAKKQYKETHNYNTSNTNYADIVRRNRNGIEVACQTDEYISSSIIPKSTQPPTSDAASGVTGLTPLHPLPPLLPTVSLPPPCPTSTPPSLPSSSRSTDPAPPSLVHGEGNVAPFKTPPLPKRGKKNRKTGKKKSESSGDEMDNT